MKNLEKLTWMMLLMLSFGLFTACSDDDEEAPKPVATFQFEVSDTNPMEVSFKNYSQNATGYSWDFGDGVGTSTEKDPTYTYTEGGTFTVTMNATGEGGSANHSKDVTVIKPGGDNLLQNGEFDDESVWTILQHNPNNTGTLTIADGVATFNKGVTGQWGTEPHIGINQAVEVAAGTYQFNLDITTNGIADVWFEVWVGTGAPVADDDYNGDDGATPVLAFNTWRCPDNATYSGPMAAASCPDLDNGFDMDGSITLDAGTYYVVIRSGGLNFNADGIVIDNVTMVKID